MFGYNLHFSIALQRSKDVYFISSSAYAIESQYIQVLIVVLKKRVFDLINMPIWCFYCDTHHG